MRLSKSRRVVSGGLRRSHQPWEMKTETVLAATHPWQVCQVPPCLPAALESQQLLQPPFLLAAIRARVLKVMLIFLTH